ncbi:hypothetical protein M3Y99_01556400 [Aphelenchoides fujianensis]|nr:hypothetical protein M3Y99_01556400 [Aphelenchoides fujianensis]
MIADTSLMPDLSHLSEEERAIIEQVFQRQKEEEQKETVVAQQADKELEDIEKTINERKENARKLVGTQNDAICQICQKTKFADGIGHKCFHCELRSCARCGGRTTHKNRSIWACSTCQKRQELFARSGKWFQSDKAGVSPSNSQSEGAEAGGFVGGEADGPLPQQPATSVTPQPPLTQRQSSIHRQSSVEAEAHKMNGAVHSGNAPVHNPHQPAAPLAQQPPAAARVAQPVGPQAQPQAARTQQPHPQQQPPAYQRQPSSSTAPVDAQRRAEQPVAHHRVDQNGAVPGSSRAGALKPQRSYDAHAVRSKTETMPPEFTNGHHPPSGASRPTTADPRVRQRADKTGATSPRDPAGRTVRHGSRSGASGGSRVPAVPEGTSLDAGHRQSSGPTTLHGGSRMRRGKLSRQIRSLSSSEDDEIGGITGASRRHSAMEPDFSEKDLLKYIYGNHRFSKPNTVTSQPGMGFTNSLPGSRLGLHDFNSSSTSTPALNHFMQAGTSTLATKIRQFLQQPVSWQPSADQRRLIGHIVLQRPENDTGDLGLKVIGGRHSSTGRLGAFITQVKPGSVADLVGQLRPGDEVLEWNGEILQNLTHEGVYQVISAAKNSPKVELIVSRSAQSPSEELMSARRGLPSAHSSTHSHVQQQSPVAHSDYGVSTGMPNPYLSDHYRIPHSKSLVNPHMAFLPEQNDAPLIHKHLSPRHRGNVLGKLEFSMLYLPHERELLVTIYQAIDLPPRTTGTLRNPYVKVFLLPNRSEESRRQSKITYETLNPVWNECFFYYNLTPHDLTKRVLEITVWDFDQYNGHEFLGETVIDLSQILLDNQHFSYPLVDNDDENPLRIRARQSRISSPYGTAGYSTQERYRSQSATCDDHRHNYELNHKYQHAGGMPPGGHYSHTRDFLEQHDPAAGMGGGHRSKYDEMDWTANGYLSDHAPPQYNARAAGNQYNNHNYRRPRSATGFRHLADFEARSAPYRNQPISEEIFDERGRPLPPAHQPKGAPAREHAQQLAGQPPQQYDPYGQQYAQQGYAPPSDPMMAYPRGQGTSGTQPPGHPAASSAPHHPNQQPRGMMDGMEFMSNRQRELILQEQSGYGSDGSETLSANSAQSMQKRAANREEEHHLQQQMQHHQMQQQQQQMQGGGQAMNLQDIPTYSPRHHFYENPANSAYASGSQHQQHQQQQQQQSTQGYASSAAGGRDEYGGKLNGGGQSMDDTPPSQSTRVNGGAGSGGSGAGSTASALAMKERKKSLMTRLIPGRNAMADGKRTGFARSEEVGIPDSMTGGGLGQNGDAGMMGVPFMKQSSKDSTDSSHSDNFQPILAEGTLGQFVDNLGPGQVVGRQALASPVLGEIQLSLYLQDGALIVDVKRAKNLVVRQGTKINPAPYVKVYLMHNKQCVAKAKTQTVRKTTAPIFNQKLSFSENYKHKMFQVGGKSEGRVDHSSVQVSVLGDHGRMERKSFMGIAQIRLDDLQLGSSNVSNGWYKLFHNTSLAGTAPVRKDSENSLMEM